MTTPPPIPAGFGRRLGALAIDWVAAIAVARLVTPQFPYGSAESALATLAVFALEVIVFTWLIAASFGQRIVGIAIVRIDGGRLGLGAVVLRTLLICLVIPALVYDSEGRGLQDRATRSRAVLRASVPGLGRPARP